MSIEDNKINLEKTEQTNFQSAPNNAAQNSAPGGAEMFVGLNILSKVGVVFIIIGVIAFTAVSEDYIPAWGRMAMVFALGAVMAVLGELFFRKDSPIFARALTLGAIFDWCVGVLVGYYGFGALNDTAAALVGAVAAAGGLALAWRYGSQTIMAATLMFSALPFFAAGDGIVGLFTGMAAAAVIHAAGAVICHLKNWYASGWFGMFTALVLAIAARLALLDLDNAGGGITATVFALIIFGVYTAAATVRSYQAEGRFEVGHADKLYVPSIVSLIFTLIYMLGVSRLAAGITVLVFTAVYVIIAVCVYLRFGRCSLVSAYEGMVLLFIPASLFFVLAGRWFIIALLVYGAALEFIGVLRDDKKYRVLGDVVLVFGELGFLVGGLSHMSLPIFPYQFAVNAAVFLAVMIVYAAKKRYSFGFTLFSAFAVLNATLFFIYLISAKLMPAAAEAAEIGVREEGVYSLLFCTVVWLASAFITGKLRFMDKGAGYTSICFYIIGLLQMFVTNIQLRFAQADNAFAVIAVILVNLLSVAAVLDIVKRTEAIQSRTSKSMALIVSAYGLFTLTVVLGTNGWVAFTSCIISIIYILVAVFWIVLGFMKNKPLTRRFGLALSLLASAKLFLFDFTGIDAMGRTLMFIGFGITLLAISFVYGYFERKAKFSEKQ